MQMKTFFGDMKGEVSRRFYQFKESVPQLVQFVSAPKGV